MLREVEVLKRLTGSPAKPYVVILGGSKVSDKLAVIEALLPKVDRLLIGGGMCFTFLAAQGHDVGGSLLEEAMVETCARLLAECRRPDPAADRRGRGRRGVGGAQAAVVAADAIPAGMKGLDIGPRSGERCSPPRCEVPRRCSGTGRWAFSSSRLSPPAPAPSPKRWPV